MLAVLTAVPLIGGSRGNLELYRVPSFYLSLSPHFIKATAVRNSLKAWEEEQSGPGVCW